MNDATQKMLVTVGAGLAKKVLMLQAAALVSHGVLSSNYTEVYVSLGMAGVGAVWSLWNDYGRAIVLSQLEVLKAKSLAQAQQARLAGLPQVTVTDIAAQSRTMTPADVAKAVAKLPPENQATVAPVKAAMTMAVAVLALAGLVMPSGRATAQTAADPFGLNKFLQSPLVKALQQWPVDDVNGAETMATSIPNLQDPVGQACWQQFQALGTIVKQHPLPLSFKVAQDLEAARLFTMAIKNVCKTPSCTQMFADLSNQIGAFTPIPTGLSLSAVCAKIP
jgi:hypothetical protein